MWFGLREKPGIWGKEVFGVGVCNTEAPPPEMARVELTMRAARLQEGSRWKCITGMCCLGIWFLEELYHREEEPR